jgi:hypothetical protein
MGEKKKHIFHASKVDRIAIVDRPAVPDAEILVFKRDKEQQAEKSFNFAKEFAVASAYTAVQVLETGLWGIVYDETDSTKKVSAFKVLVKEFTGIVVGIATQLESGRVATKAEGPTVADATAHFQRGLTMSAMFQGFEYLKNSIMSFLVHSFDYYKDTPAILKNVSEAFGEYVIKHLSELEVSKSLTAEKIGRKISDARIKKLQQALSALNEIISEVTDAEEKGKKEDTNMEMKEIQEAISSAIEKSLASVTEQLGKFKTVLEEKGILEKPLTPEEKAKKDEAEKKAKDESEKKAQSEATAKAEAEKKLKEESEKKEKELSEIKEKAQKVDEMSKELTEIKTKYAGIEKSLAAFEKRTGVKVSLDVDTTNKNDKGGDVFAEALRN